MHPDSTPTSRRVQLLQLLGVCGVVVAQPLLSTFGSAPDWFVFVGASARDIVVFSLLVALGPPIALWAVVQVGGWGRARRRDVLQAAALGGLAVLGGLQIGAAAGWPIALTAPLALAGGAALALADRRWSGVRAWTAWLAPFPVLVLTLFWFHSPTSGLIRADDVAAADLGAFGSGPPPPVVVLVFDEWPLASILRTDGTLDAALYPNVADLADDATWYRDTTTVANLTNFAVPALLTGNDPDEGRTADASSHPQNLFTLLGGTYDLDVTERITRLCPPSLCTADQEGPGGTDAATVGDLLREARAVFVDRLGPGEREAPPTDAFVEPETAVALAEADDGDQDLDDLLRPRPETLTRFLAGFARDEEPTVHFLHLLEPHTPHQHLPDGRRYGADPALRQITVREDGEPGDDRRSPAPAPARLDRQRLQLEVAHLDGLIGDVIQRLRRTGLYDEALVVVTSDHGIAFRPGGPVRGLGVEPIGVAAQPELLWVPLLVKAPGQRNGEVSDETAELVDVLPTIADRLGIDLPWSVDGRALGTGAPARERRFAHVVGSSFATFQLDDPAPVEATVADVERLGVDHVLPGRGPDRWWSTGNRPGWIDRPPPTRALPADLDQFEALLDVDPGDDVVPALVSGRVPAGVDRVAVAVNGRVAAVTDTFSDQGGPGRFAAMVDPDRYRRGANRVSVHPA